MPMTLVYRGGRGNHGSFSVPREHGGGACENGYVRSALGNSNDLAARITGGRTYTASERASLEAAAQARSFTRRREVLAGAFSAAEVAELLGTSLETLHDRVKAGALLGVPDGGALRFPAWQFDPKGEGGLVEGLPGVLKVLRASPFGKAYWLSRSNPHLGDRTPIAALKGGEVEAVRRLAESVGVI